MGFLELIPLVGKVLDRVLPDKIAAAEAKLKVLELAQQGELAYLDADLKLAQGQMQINAAEASNPSVFVSGWRPFVGWTCAAGMAAQFVIGPFFTFVAGVTGHPYAWPTLDLSTMMPLLFGLLGLGAYRTAERIKGVARE